MKKKIAMMVAFGCLGASAMSDNYDLLGRKGSKMNSPMVYKNVDYSKTQKQEQEKIGSSLENRGLAKMASGIKGNVKAIVGKFGPKGYAFTDCSKKTKGCGEGFLISNGDLTWSEYLTEVNKNFIKIKSQQTGLFDSGYNYVTAELSKSGSLGYTVTESPYNVTGTNADGTKTLLPSDPGFPSYVDANVITSIDYRPFSKLYRIDSRIENTESNVGIYLAEEAVPTRLNKKMDEFAPFILADGAMDDYNKNPGFEMRASRMYRVVENVSGRSVFFATKSRPSNPSNANPQIYMGLHSYGGNVQANYVSKTQDLDNYIYEKRTVEVVAAGNNRKKFSGEALAANAITVGAVDPLTKEMTRYTPTTDSSATLHPHYGSSGKEFFKPDIKEYSQFYFDYVNYPEYYRKYKSSSHTYKYYPYYDGTEAAAAIVAGKISNMLSANEFYKWHPEVVKAVAMNRDGYNYDDFVFDQKDKKNVHHSYYFIGDVNTLMKEYNNDIDESEIYCYGKCKEIRFKGSLDHFVSLNKNSTYTSNEKCKVEGFTASIAWLNSGNDLLNLGTLPQIYEIEVYHQSDNGTYHVNESSTRSLDRAKKYTPARSVRFEKVVSGRASQFLIRIVLTEEDSRSENYGQMVLGLDIKPICK